MTIELLEAAVDALQSHLEDNMAAKVSELNTRYGDDYELVDIKAWYPGNLPQSTPEAPSVVIHGAGFSPGDQRLANIMITNGITVIVFVGDDNVEARFRKLCRYAVGIVELLGTAKASIGYITKLSGQVAVTDAMDTQPFLQGITIPVSLARAEDY